MTTVNPYAAPKAAVADTTVVLNADYVPGGGAQPAGHGWRWIAEGWDLFKRQPGMWIGMWLVFVVMMLVVAFIPFLGSILTGLFWPVFMGGFAIACRTLDEGKDMEFGQLFAGFRERIGTLLAVGAISLVASLVVGLIVGLTIVGGMLGLMGGDPDAMAGAAPATILLAVLVTFAVLLPVMMAVWFTAPLVVFQELGAIESMKQSFTGCLRNIVPFLLYGVIGLGLLIVACIPLGLGLLVFGPVITASVYTAYRDIYLKPR